MRKAGRGRKAGSRILEVMVEPLAPPAVFNARRELDECPALRSMEVDEDLFLIELEAPTLVTLARRDVRDLTSIVFRIDRAALRVFGDRILASLDGQDTRLP